MNSCVSCTSEWSTAQPCVQLHNWQVETRLGTRWWSCMVLLLHVLLSKPSSGAGPCRSGPLPAVRPDEGDQLQGSGGCGLFGARQSAVHSSPAQIQQRLAVPAEGRPHLHRCSPTHLAHGTWGKHFCCHHRAHVEALSWLVHIPQCPMAADHLVVYAVRIKSDDLLTEPFASAPGIAACGPTCQSNHKPTKQQN